MTSTQETYQYSHSTVLVFTSSSKIFLAITAIYTAFWVLLSPAMDSTSHTWRFWKSMATCWWLNQINRIRCYNTSSSVMALQYLPFRAGVVDDVLCEDFQLFCVRVQTGNDFANFRLWCRLHHWRLHFWACSGISLFLSVCCTLLIVFLCSRILSTGEGDEGACRIQRLGASFLLLTL